jgi:hypothetical protein
MGCSLIETIKVPEYVCRMGEAIGSFRPWALE